MKKLFLDDIRVPSDAYTYTKEEMFKDNDDWTVVRNYHQFVDHININGLPDFISFDHDLADEHYVPEEYWDTWERSKEYQFRKERNYKEKTGKECARWLVNFCMDNQFSLPEFYVHSMNPIGKENIESLLNQAKFYL